jgi:hypothetical protein
MICAGHSDGHQDACLGNINRLMDYSHRLSINRPTMRGKEKSPSDGHCQCQKEKWRALAIRHTHIHTYHSRFIPEGVAEVSQIFLRDTHVLPKLVSYEEHCRRDRW